MGYLVRFLHSEQQNIHRLATSSQEAYNILNLCLEQTLSKGLLGLNIYYYR